MHLRNLPHCCALTEVPKSSRVKWNNGGAVISKPQEQSPQSERKLICAKMVHECLLSLCLEGLLIFFSLWTGLLPGWPDKATEGNQGSTVAYVYTSLPSHKLVSLSSHTNA